MNCAVLRGEESGAFGGSKVIGNLFIKKSVLLIRTYSEAVVKQGTFKGKYHAACSRV